MSPGNSVSPPRIDEQTKQMDDAQLSFLQPTALLPEGFDYRCEIVTPDEERDLVERFGDLNFRAFEFHGFRGKRRVVSFGLHYDFEDNAVQPTEEIPAFLLPLRERVASFAGIPAPQFVHALVTEYGPGAGIGWHRDRSVFEDVVGVSLVTSCRFRLRRKIGNAWQRASVILEPRSAYLLRGPVRTAWQHSIPAMESLRYSVTFRSMRAARDRPSLPHRVA
jgi:alkylated DNA repair dioxygenase AlkB